ncbi:sensor histidine kinase [Paenibacillus sacheonensis]|uniref:HAMP domain-containing protein n=1 Tax=Paenibacillus sacheonensis TaxID=742054 RepID=A0A7X4YUG2_9BACL|nr:sensor histidine kinase [Paenibacillus sacheonensis]MBM7569207.1 sensor histidine kinase YesM [Paenibacillus sacheonensis]NBC71781.1 HAMP domain-containing protein [Paenibacillus sacheonensis]
MNLRPKLLLAFITLIVLPLIGLGIASFLKSEHLLEKKYGEQTEITLKAVGGNIRYFFRELDQLSDSSVTNPSVQEALRSSRASVNDASRLIAISQYEKSLGKILFQNPALSMVVLYGKDGTMFRSYRNDPTTFKPIPYDLLQGHSVYPDIMRLAGRPLWLGPYEQPELTGTGAALFTQMRLVKDVDTLNDSGIMVTQIKSDEVDNMLQDFTLTGELQTQTRYLIIDRDGLVMMDSRHELDGRLVEDETKLDLQATERYASYHGLFGREDSLISAYNLDRSGWVLVSVKSWQSLTSENVRFLQWIGGITLLCLISAVLFNIFFVSRVAKAIIRVVRKMRLVEQGVLDTRVPATGKDETVLLARSFNSMVDTIGRLLSEVRTEQERKQRAEMMLMQAQIKPHFLFNTLESINALAAQNEGGKIMAMVRRLSILLRTSMHHSEIITIRQEIEHVRSYLDIQKYRFEDVFSYELDIPEEALDDTILKLTLQPLVENSIQHGFEGLPHMGMIHIALAVEENELVFMISDNGIGMDVVALKRINGLSRIRERGLDADDAVHGERRGLGLHNVADRLRIHYGARYGLRLCSAAGHGTVIRITIPRQR